MKNENKLNEIRNEIKSHITASGFTMTDVAKKLGNKKSKVNLQNLSNKLTNETLRYKEAKAIAEMIGYEIKWVEKGK